MTLPPPPPPGMVALPRPVTTPSAAVPLPTAERPPPAEEPRLRNIVAALLAIIATALIAASVLLGWVDRTVLPTPNFVRTGSSAVTDPAIALPVQRQLTEQVSAQLTPLVADPAGASTATFDAAAFNATVAQAAGAAVASPLARASWSAALTVTHDRSIALARGALPAQAEIDATQIVVDLGPLAAATRDQVAQAGYPAVAGVQFGVTPFIVTSSASAVNASDAVRIADTWSWPALLLGLIAAAGAYASSTRRGRLTLLLGADVLVAAGALWLTARLVGNVAGDRGLTPQDQEALSALYPPFGQSLRQDAIITAVVGGVFVVAAIIVLSVQASSDRRVRSAERIQQSTSEAL